MPLYEYECPVCRRHKEELRPYEQRDSMAPSCQGGASFNTIPPYHKPAVCVRIDHVIGKTPVIDHMGTKETEKKK